MLKPYTLIDSGYGRKLEQFGEIVLDRPCAQAIWKPALAKNEWQNAHGKFERLTEKDGRWKFFKKIPEHWDIKVHENIMKCSTTSFGHVGMFPEQHAQWHWLNQTVQKFQTQKVLNLFAYSGGSTLACASAGAKVIHLDASKPMVTWARENAEKSSLAQDKTVWVVEDVSKFLKREVRRGNTYNGIILDPPSFGRGPKKELFKIEQHFQELLDLCMQALDKNRDFVLLSCHTPGLSAQVLENVLRMSLNTSEGHYESGEMVLQGEKGTLPLPSGCYTRWTKN